MWMVSFHGGWQPAETDAIVFEWIRQGLIGPQTPIRHSSWATPVPLAQVPVFSPLLKTPSAFSVPSPKPVASGINPKVGKALAWTLGMIFVFGLIRALAASSVVVGLLAIIFGLATIGTIIAARASAKAPALTMRINALFVRRPLLLVGWITVLILSGVLGTVVHHERTTECEKTVALFTSMTDRNETNANTRVIGTSGDWKQKAAHGREICTLVGRKDELAKLEVSAAELERQQADAVEMERLKAEKQRVEAAKLAKATREKHAIETFPVRSTEIGKMLKSAATAATQTKWEESASTLDAAQNSLDEFKGTSVENSREWRELSSKITEQRKRIQPQIDRISEQRRAAQAKVDTETAQRGPKPRQSAWDGEVVAVHSFLKRALKDPDSYKFDKCTNIRPEGVYWIVECSYRAKNSFGAVVLEAKRFYIQAGGVADEGQVVRTEDLDL